jgi:hypothetical protein
MNDTLDRARARLRVRLAGAKALVSMLLSSLRPSRRRFATARMCPFCGLITPRFQSSCLECGKRLIPANTK